MGIYSTTAVTNARVAELSWMTGQWRGSHGHDEVEEHWSEPSQNTMMGMFRWETLDGVRFYELLVIEQDGAEIYLRLKHFNPGLKGWEEKDEATEFLLVQLEYKRAVFLQTNKPDAPWLIYMREGDSRLVSFFEKDDSFPKEDEKFIFHRIGEASR